MTIAILSFIGVIAVIVVFFIVERIFNDITAGKR